MTMKGQTNTGAKKNGERVRLLWLRIALLGLVGVASLAAVPFERLVPDDIDPLLLRLLAMIQPAMMIVGAALLGAWAAPRVGLGAPIVEALARREGIGPLLRRQAGPVLGVATIVAAMLVLFWRVVVAAPSSGQLLSLEMPLITKLLYGGIAEEVLLRWGLMSALVLAAWRLAARSEAQPPRGCFVAAIIVSAGLFAIGHLPILFLLAPAAGVELVLLVLAANLVPGLLFGWLYWRHGLEAAMLAHAGAHLAATIGLALLQP
jgi:hypothetical protein